MDSMRRRVSSSRTTWPATPDSRSSSTKSPSSELSSSEESGRLRLVALGMTLFTSLTRSPRYLGDGHPLQYHGYHHVALLVRRFFVYVGPQPGQCHVLERHPFGVWLRVRQPTSRCHGSDQQVLQRNVVPAPALELGEGHVHGDLLRPGGETALPLKESRLLVILSNASWAKSSMLASASPVRPPTAVLNPLASRS